MIPGVSNVEDNGIIPEEEIMPRVGLKAYTPLANPGIMRLPFVSVPRATSQNPEATAIAEPLLEPPGVKDSPCGFFPCPPNLFL